MPPRVSGAALPLAAMDASLPQASRRSARCPVHCFSTTARAQKISKARYDMYQWLKDAGPRLEGARGPVYLGKDHASQPFPANPLYRSQPVLSTAMREDIFARVMDKGESLKSVSAELGVDVRRVAAVIRLMQVQKDWEAQGKKLATPYARAVMKMLPQTHPDEGEGAPPHEPINDIHVHNLTLQQLFVPVSESRTFTRRDAARAFHETLSSVDVRSPQANLIVAERAVLAGKTAAEAKKEFEALNVKEEDEYARKIGEEQALLEKRTIRHRTDRCEFRFQTYNANDVGKTGRKADAVGWRYGAPLQDRKRGAVKIPTSVP